MNWIIEKGHQLNRWLKGGPRRIPGLLAMGCGVVLIIVYIWLSYGSSGEVAAPQAQATAPAQGVEAGELECRLEAILSRMDGVGQVSVMITYETGSEIVPAMSVQRQITTEEQTGADGTTQRTQQEIEDAQLASGQSELVVLTEKMPRVLGVVVVAEGADDLFVRMNLRQAVETVLQIPPQQVEVFPMQTQQGGEESNDRN